MLEQKGYIVGVDEAGRGAWAGPVYAAAVILNPESPLNGLKDSKLLNAKQRDVLYDKIVTEAVDYGIGFASVEEIDTVNILQATFLAMQRAVAALSQPFAAIWVDGHLAPVWSWSTRCIVNGDQLEPVISAASILAKVSRDRLMQSWDADFPYDFGKHKGYGTALHQQKLRQHGVSSVHRRSFKPVKLCLALEDV